MRLASAARVSRRSTAAYHAGADTEALAESAIERGEAVESPGVGDVGDGPGSA